MPGLRPVGVVDIGSNSVRLVVYEGLVRSATPVYNEKVLCGLGRHVATRAVLNEEAIEEALQALTRYRAICEHIGTEFVHVVATAAVREAKNGPDFVARATAVMGTDIKVLTGAEEARLCGFGVLSGMYRPDGLAADMGGGSLEIVDVNGTVPGEGVSLPLGGLHLRDLAGGSMKKIRRLVSESLDTTTLPSGGHGRDLYAIGGSFRALGRLHMAQTGYPLHVMHGYGLATDEALEFCRLVARVKPDSLDSVDVVAPARRALLPHGAVVLAELLERARPRSLLISAFGVREGLLHTLLPERERDLDPLLSSCEALAFLRSRSPRHAHELCAWTDQLMTSAGLEETEEERRLRHSACLLADIGWRAHPDYRGEQTLNLIAHAAFAGIDHQGRAYLALSIYYRHAGLKEELLSPRIRELASARTLDRARVLGAALRVAYLVSAAMPGLIDRTPLVVQDGVVVLRLPGSLKRLAGERLAQRLKQFGKLLGRKSAIELAG